MRRAVLLLCLALAAPARASAQDPVKVWATLSDTDIPLGETTVLELHVETRGAAPERIVPPTLPPDVELVGTRDYSQIQFSLPGGRSRLVRRELVLRPGAAGRYRIPPFTVTVQGRTYRTSSLTLEVSRPAGGAVGVPPGAGGGGGGGGAVSASPRAGAPGAAARGPGDEVLFSSELLPDTVYVGQQVTLRSDVMVSERAQFRLRRAPEYVPPDAPGFWVHDLPDPGGATPRVIGGRVYYGRTLTRAYFPLAPGSYTLEPARLIYEIRRGVLYSPQSQELVSDSLRLTVLALPDGGRPASFTGAVGRFRVRARIEPDEVSAGDAVALTVEVEGEGNVKALPPPRLPELADVQVFPPSEEADVRTDGGVLKGVKRFTWVLVPDGDGRIEIPPVEYAFFDPERRTYDIARTAPLTLAVRPGGPAGVVADAAEEIRYLKSAPAGPPPLRWVRSPWFAALQLVPLLGMIWILAGRGRARQRRPSRRALRQRLRRDLDRLRRRAGGDASIYHRELDALIRGWLAERLDRPELRRAEPPAARGIMEACGVGASTAAAVAALIERVRRNRFAPVAPGSAARLEEADEALRLLLAVDREAPPPRRAAAAAGAAGIAAALLLASPGPGRAQVPDAFARGAERFHTGDYRGASAAFAAYVDAHPEDAHAWYNLGNAHFRAGDRGRAVWAWLRALELAPRDADARHNLRVANADRWLIARATPLLPLSRDEFLLLAGAAWLIGAFAGVRFLRRRRRTAAIIAGTGVLCAICLVGAWGAGAARVGAGVVLAERVALRAAPHLRAEPLRELEAASGVLLIERRDAWLRVRLPDGAEGWLEAADVGGL